jgi:DNA repair protein RadA/Sms
MFEGDRGHSYRVLRAIKNRFGSTLEVGVFSMGESGLEVVDNPSELFLAERRAGAIGSCVVPLLEGTRPILLEVQSLVAPASYGTARAPRSASTKGASHCCSPCSRAAAASTRSIATCT